RFGIRKLGWKGTGILDAVRIHPCHSRLFLLGWASVNARMANAVAKLSHSCSGAVALVFSLAGLQAWSQEAVPVRALSSLYSIGLYTQSDGLPEGGIYAIDQDADGYLWVGTKDGVARF